MNKRLFSILFVALFVLTATAHAQNQVIEVWPNGVPEMEGQMDEEQAIKSPFDGFTWVRNVTNPTLTAYLPDPSIANGTGIIVAPGGGFHFLSMESEGSQVAEWLVERGIAAFVLKYRLVPTPTEEQAFMELLGRLFADLGSARPQMDKVTPLAIKDGEESIRILRRRADEFNLSPDRIGIIGFSAGGRVASGVAMSTDPESRPTFAAPIYGGAPTNEISIPADAPPLFTLVAQDDQLAAQSVMDLYEAWHKAGHEAELHIYSKGGHGFGMKKQDLPIDTWIERFGDWLEVQGLLN
ncbi:MAG: alpha/beta hydrolase [Rhodothermaceae bacterium]|nr:alpha/beta hydrolase [Rhodothermaceae bacterium]